MAQNAQKISISLPSELVSFLTTAAKASRLSRSRYLAQFLREKVREGERRLMIEGYQAMAEEDRRLAEERVTVAMEVWPKDGQAW